MRPSNRGKILDAAALVVERDGVAGVTFDSVSEASGYSKGGLLYHFPSKDHMLLALHEHLAAKWEAQLVAALGRDPEGATEGERLAAYARVSANSKPGAELLMMIEASVNPELKRPWSYVASRWMPTPDRISPNDRIAVRKLLAFIAADGLWVSDSVGEKIPLALREALATEITSLLAPDK